MCVSAEQFLCFICSYRWAVPDAMAAAGFFLAVSHFYFFVTYNYRFLNFRVTTFVKNRSKSHTIFVVKLSQSLTSSINQQSKVNITTKTLLVCFYCGLFHKVIVVSVILELLW